MKSIKQTLDFAVRLSLIDPKPTKARAGSDRFYEDKAVVYVKIGKDGQLALVILKGG